MKVIFEQYGKVILSLIVVIAVVSLIFGGVQIYKVLGDEASLDMTFSHSGSENALRVVSEREKPTIFISDSDGLHLYKNQVFQPLKTVSCKDMDGNTLVVIVTSIIFIDSEDGSQMGLLEHYNKSEDKIDMSTAINKPGVLSVTYQATDEYNVTATKTISYAVDETET